MAGARRQSAFLLFICRNINCTSIHRQMKFCINRWLIQKLFDEIKKGRFEELIIEPGDIIRIKPNGKNFFKDKFKYSDYSYYQWWNYEISDNDYVEKFKKTAAAYQGYPPDMVDDLMNNGFSPEEIEDYIYCVE
ncbi:MAG: hypothetical protein L6V93_05190 [Clostridiales bacterium]|nr:MAG: hypothetical protein L6V93_05190 [Clostridiales bacterium]